MKSHEERTPEDIAKEIADVRTGIVAVLNSNVRQIEEKGRITIAEQKFVSHAYDIINNNNFNYQDVTKLMRDTPDGVMEDWVKDHLTARILDLEALFKELAEAMAKTTGVQRNDETLESQPIESIIIFRIRKDPNEMLADLLSYRDKEEFLDYVKQNSETVIQNLKSAPDQAEAFKAAKIIFGQQMLAAQFKPTQIADIIHHMRHRLEDHGARNDASTRLEILYSNLSNFVYPHYATFEDFLKQPGVSEKLLSSTTLEPAISHHREQLSGQKNIPTPNKNGFSEHRKDDKYGVEKPEVIIQPQQNRPRSTDRPASPPRPRSPVRERVQGFFNNLFNHQVSPPRAEDRNRNNLPANNPPSDNPKKPSGPGGRQ